MRLFGIEEEDTFKEFVKTPFKSDHEESVLENWLESNPDGIVEDGKLLMIGRQVTTNLGTFIDLLALDRQGNVVVLELKRDRTPRDTLAQALEYSSFVETLDLELLENILRTYINDESVNLVEYHREYFELGVDEGVAFNKDQRIVIVGQKITDEIRQTSTFLRKKGLLVSCLEFTFFEADGGAQLLSHDLVVGKEFPKAKGVSSGSLPVVSKDEFLESLNEYGKPVFKSILDFAESNSLPVHWGTKGFSLNVDVNGLHVAICFGYPPSSVYKQSLYTTVRRFGGPVSKLDASEDVADSLLSIARETGFFQTAGRELKCPIIREFSESEIESLLRWIEETVERIKELSLQDGTFIG